MREGFWRVYRNHVDEQGKAQKMLVARFLLHGDHLEALDDHSGILKSLAPHGKVNGTCLARLERMHGSPYWDLVHKDDIEQGHRPDLLPEVE